MPYSIDPRPEERMIITNTGGEFNIREDVEPYLETLGEALDQMPGPSVIVTDTRGLTMDFASLTRAIDMLAHGKLSIMKHPNLHAIVVITDNSLASLGARALKQVQYGAARAIICATMEEAIERAKGELEMSA